MQRVHGSYGDGATVQEILRGVSSAVLEIRGPLV